MSYRTVLDPASVEPRGDLVLAVQYTKPSKVGLLYLPEYYDKDGTWNWWEVIKAGPDAERKLGIRLQAGDIIRTPWRPPIDTGCEDAQGRMLFFIPCVVKKAGPNGKLVEEANITGIIPKYWED